MSSPEYWFVVYETWYHSDGSKGFSNAVTDNHPFAFVKNLPTEVKSWGGAEIETVTSHKLLFYKGIDYHEYTYFQENKL